MIDTDVDTGDGKFIIVSFEVALAAFLAYFDKGKQQVNLKLVDLKKSEDETCICPCQMPADH